MMNANFADISDLKILGISMTPQQEEAAEVLISAASAKLRVICKKYGKNPDEMQADKDMAAVMKNTVIQAVYRALSSISDSAPSVSQTSQSALGYSVSMTYLNAGQSVYFMRNELKDLGLMRQTYGGLEMYENETDDNGK